MPLGGVTTEVVHTWRAGGERLLQRPIPLLPIQLRADPQMPPHLVGAQRVVERHQLAVPPDAVRLPSSLTLGLERRCRAPPRTERLELVASAAQLHLSSLDIGRHLRAIETHQGDLVLDLPTSTQQSAVCTQRLVARVPILEGVLRVLRMGALRELERRDGKALDGLLSV